MCTAPVRTLTIDSDLAITVAVTGGEESLGLLVGECSGSGREVLQEQPVRKKATVTIEAACQIAWMGL